MAGYPREELISPYKACAQLECDLYWDVVDSALEVVVKTHQEMVVETGVQVHVLRS